MAKTIVYKSQIVGLQQWLFNNSDEATGLVFSHVGDERFKYWTVTYDSAMVALSYIATGEIDRAKRIIDFYIDTPKAWRLGGIIDIVNSRNPSLGEDWSVRTGSNIWMGIAAFHLYLTTKDSKYLALSKKIADFAISLQDINIESITYGGIRLGPKGEAAIPADQHIGYDKQRPEFYDIFSAEHTIDAYALFNLLFNNINEGKYKDARDRALIWIRKIAFNRNKKRFNRGYYKDVDVKVASDVHSWGISALGVDELDNIETGLADKLVSFLEKECISKVAYVKPDGNRVEVSGVDFVDKETARILGRDPLVSPEWTFQLANAYLRLSYDYKTRGDNAKETLYSAKREKLLDDMLILAFEKDEGIEYPYATLPDAPIGHEYNTPHEGNASAISAAYGILAFSGFDPLYMD